MNARQGIILGGVLAAFALPSGAGAEDAPTAAEAEATLESAQDAIATPGDEEPTRELTLAFAELSQALPALEGGDRTTARRILARPDDGPNDRYGDGYSVDEADESPVCDTHFCVHWVSTTRDKPPAADNNGTDDGDDVPDFVEEVLASAQDSFTVENTNLNWTEPVGDDDDGGGTGSDKTDIYLIETNGAYFGYASPDEGQGATTSSKQAYLVLDNDYDEFGSIDPIDALQVTMAHEYNHVLQFAYDSLEDGWMFESTATWMENNVYPDIDDYINYVPYFARTSKIPLTRNGAFGLKIYGAAVWNHYLQGTSGPGDVRDAWDASPTVDPAHLSVAAYDSVLAGGTGASPFPGMGSTFAEFAFSTAEWRSQPSIYADAAQLPDMKRVGTLQVGDGYKKVKLDHLAYALFNVRTGPAQSSDLRLHVKTPDNTRSGFAIIGRRGAPTSGDFDRSYSIFPDGSGGSAVLGSSNFSRVTAAVVNADPRVNGAGDYTRDGRKYKVKVTSE